MENSHGHSNNDNQPAKKKPRTHSSIHPNGATTSLARARRLIHNPDYPSRAVVGYVARQIHKQMTGKNG